MLRIAGHKAVPIRLKSFMDTHGWRGGEGGVVIIGK